MPDARITSLDICIKDCNAKDYRLVTKSAELTSEMLTMVANLPPGTPFTVTVKVVDGKGNPVAVPAGKYVWKG
jgi:protocatechuate 3,4-dioxygenase beta subunit